MKPFAMLLIVSTLAGCQTTKLSVPVSLGTICMALAKSDALPVLNDIERALIRERFSRAARDALKTPAGLMAALGCPGAAK